jgi:Tfp pilus assembly protein PilF
MNLRVAQGSSIRLPAEFFSDQDPVDPLNPLVTVFNPSSVAVVSDAKPERDDVGVYHLDFGVPEDAPLGTWKANWTGTIDGKPVGGEDIFEVVGGEKAHKTTEISTDIPSVSAPPDEVTETRVESRSFPSRKTIAKRAKRTRLVVIGVIVLASAVVGGLYLNGQDKTGRTLSSSAALQEGLQAQRAGNLEEAGKRYGEALKADPKNKYAHYNLGTIAQRANRNAEAKRRYELALASDPNFVPALFNLAIAHERIGENEQAARLYRRILSLDANHANAHLNLGFLLIAKLGNQPEGLSELRKATELNPTLASRVPPEIRRILRTSA